MVPLCSPTYRTTPLPILIACPNNICVASILPLNPNLSSSQLSQPSFCPCSNPSNRYQNMTTQANGFCPKSPCNAYRAFWILYHYPQCSLEAALQQTVIKPLKSLFIINLSVRSLIITPFPTTLQSTRQAHTTLSVAIMTIGFFIAILYHFYRQA